MRWDSDHVVLLNDDIRFLFEELVRSDGLERTAIGLDFFDGSINRLGAWAVGARSALKGLLFALLQPQETLVELEEKGKYFERLALSEEMKTMPFGAVWDHYCLECNAPTDAQLAADVGDYEKNVLAERS
jgi:L-rhamnose isomerase